MTERVKILCEEAAKLTPDELADLLDVLLAMTHEPPADADDGFEQEIENRVDEIDNGAVVPRDFDTVLQELRSQL
jgi:hypothetical protein